MTNPLSSAPDDTPASVIAAFSWLAVYILPALFLGICSLMRLAQVTRPPYFAFFCAFGALGALSLSIATANSPTSALGFYIAFLVSPFLLIRNIIQLRRGKERSLYHRAATWTSFFSIAVILSLLIWTVYDQYAKV